MFRKIMHKMKLQHIFHTNLQQLAQLSRVLEPRAFIGLRLIALRSRRKYKGRYEYDCDVR